MMSSVSTSDNKCRLAFLHRTSLDSIVQRCAANWRGGVHIIIWHTVIVRIQCDASSWKLL